jgi:hypothetical protein
MRRTEITRTTDCGNSPKNLAVQEIAILLEMADHSGLAGWFGDDVSWTPTGAAPLQGSAAVLRHLATRRAAPANVTVTHALSHGRAGAASGTVTRASGEVVRFAHLIRFSSVKADRVAHIDSFYDTTGGGG